MTESYNSPQSPYWAMKTFAVLALGRDDPFWICEAAPLPPLDRQRRIVKADMIIQRCIDGKVVAFPGGNPHPHGHGHTEEKYSKFAYSTRYGFSVMRSDLNLQEAAPDSVLSFRVYDRIFIRGQVENIRVEDGSITSE